MFLEECKYVAEEKKMPKYIIDDVEISSEEKNSDEENSDKVNSNEGNYNEKQMSFLREQFWKCLFRGSNFGNVLG